MPRPEKFTEQRRSRRREEQAKVEAAAFRRAEQPTKSEIAHDMKLAACLVRSLELASDRTGIADKLAALFPQVRSDWNSGCKIQPDRSLPVLGGVQPTHGEMRETIQPGLTLARKLRDWYRSLPAGLLFKMTPPQPDDPATEPGVAIEWVADTLAKLSAQHDAEAKPGQQPGARVAAQRAACWLIRFANKHALDTPDKQLHEFVFHGMRGLGVPCPDFEQDRGDFNVWITEAEALATPQSESPRGSKPKNTATMRKDEALLRSITVKDI